MISSDAGILVPEKVVWAYLLGCIRGHDPGAKSEKVLMAGSTVVFMDRRERRSQP